MIRSRPAAAPAMTQTSPMPRLSRKALLSRKAFLRGSAWAAASLLVAPGTAFAQHADASYQAHFEAAALRLDFQVAIDNPGETFVLRRLRFEPVWPGRLHQLAEPLDLGEYRLSLYDLSGSMLLFREGCSLHSEFSVRMPMP